MGFGFRGVNEGDTITLQLEVGGESYIIAADTTAEGGHASIRLRNSIRDAIQGHEELSRLLEVSTGTGPIHGDTHQRFRLTTTEPDSFQMTIVDHSGSFDFRYDHPVAASSVLIEGGTLEKDTVEVLEKKHKITGLNIPDPENFLAGTYEMEMQRLSSADANVSSPVQYAGSGKDLLALDGLGLVNNDVDVNQSVYLSVTGIDGDIITFTAEYITIEENGNVTTSSREGITLTAKQAGETFTLGNVDYEVELTAAANFTEGDRLVFNTTARADGADENTDTISVKITRDGGDYLVPLNFQNRYTLEHTTQNIQFFQLDGESGEVVRSEVEITFGDFTGFLGTGTELLDAGFTISSQEKTGFIARGRDELYNIDRFWDNNGNFLLEDPQTITIVQGDGRRASLTLFATDTLDDIKEKLNTAIGEGLGQHYLVNGNFVTYVTETMVRDEGHETVAGTFVIRSAITGKEGKLTFVGDEDFLNALSLATIQESGENRFKVDITDAHHGKVVNENVNISGNKLVGAVHENVDVKFNNMMGIKVTVDGNGGFAFTGGEAMTQVHLADRTMTFHIGANSQQDVAAAIGDMRAEALGVNNVLVINQDAANGSIKLIDGAIERVSSARGRLGALQNRLEHTINNLQVAAENLTAAESRIRDVDMTVEMMEFTKNQILMQAGTAMLAQANMRPQSVLQLLG